MPVPKLCDELGLQSTVLYRWQKELFENGSAAFQQKGRSQHPAEQGTLTGVWIAHEVRDQIVDFVRRWSEKTGIGARRFIQWLGVRASKFYDWRDRRRRSSILI